MVCSNSKEEYREADLCQCVLEDCLEQGVYDVVSALTGVEGDSLLVVLKIYPSQLEGAVSSSEFESELGDRGGE